jgi:hypothetical protein
MRTVIFAVLMTGLVVAGQADANPTWSEEDWKKYCQTTWDDSTPGKEPKVTPSLQKAIEAFGVSEAEAKAAAEHAKKIIDGPAIQKAMDQANMIDMIAIPRNNWIEATSRKNMPYYMSRHDGPAHWTVILNDAWSPYGNYFPQ